MLKKLYKSVFAVTIFLISQEVVSAASLKISASSRNVTVGSSVVITVKASDLAGTFNVSSSNSSVLSGGESNSWIENGSVTYVFKAKKTGTATITVSTVDVSDFNTAGVYRASRSVSVTVSEPVNYSKNNYLKSLSIEGVDLDFAKEKTSYSVTVPKGSTKIKINGSVEDSKANVSGLGEKNVVEGDNYFEIKVTAENGSTKVYKINAIVEEANPINTKINDSDYRVVKKANLISVPEGYSEEKITIDEIEVPAFKNAKTGLTLIGLKDSDGNIVLATYENGKFELYKELNIGNLKLYQLAFPKNLIPSKFKQVEITYNDEIIKAYQNPEEKSLYLIYAMNLETGKKNIYQYDEIEKTIQRYIENSSIDKDKLIDVAYKIGIIIIGAIISFIVVTFKIALKTKGLVK